MEKKTKKVKYRCEVCDLFECTCFCKCGLPHDQCVCGFTPEDFKVPCHKPSVEISKCCEAEWNILDGNSNFKVCSKCGKPFEPSITESEENKTKSFDDSLRNTFNSCLEPIEDWEKSKEPKYCKLHSFIGSTWDSENCNECNRERLEQAKIEIKEWEKEFDERFITDYDGRHCFTKNEIKQFISSLLSFQSSKIKQEMVKELGDLRAEIEDYNCGYHKKALKKLEDILTIINNSN
jgi:hypothetical protein